MPPTEGGGQLKQGVRTHIEQRSCPARVPRNCCFCRPSQAKADGRRRAGMAAPAGGTQTSPRAGRAAATSLYGVGHGSGGEPLALAVVSHRAAGSPFLALASPCPQLRLSRAGKAPPCERLVNWHTAQPSAPARFQGRAGCGQRAELLTDARALPNSSPPTPFAAELPQPGKVQQNHLDLLGISAKRWGHRRGVGRRAGQAQIGEALPDLTLARPGPRGLRPRAPEAGGLPLRPRS